MNPEFIRDDQILRVMHNVRGRSKFLTKAIRRESKVCLVKHEPVE
jgi:hypothetical protein